MNALLHMINSTLLHLGELQRRLAQLHEAKGISESYRKEKITEWATLTVRLLTTIEPALEIAQQEFPEYKDFITSCCDTIAKMKEAQGIKGNICQCRGCNDKENFLKVRLLKEVK